MNFYRIFHTLTDGRFNRFVYVWMSFHVYLLYVTYARQHVCTDVMVEMQRASRMTWGMYRGNKSDNSFKSSEMLSLLKLCHHQLKKLPAKEQATDRESTENSTQIFTFTETSVDLLRGATCEHVSSYPGFSSLLFSDRTRRASLFTVRPQVHSPSGSPRPR